MYHHSRTGSYGSSLKKDLSAGFELPNFTSGNNSCNFASTGMRPSSGQSYIVEKSYTARIQEKTIGYDSHLNYLSNLSHGIHIPKRDSHKQIDRNHHQRGDPIKLNRDLTLDTKFDTFGAKYESTYIPSSALDSGSKQVSNFKQQYSTADSKYEAPLRSDYTSRVYSQGIDYRVFSPVKGSDSKYLNEMNDSGYATGRYSVQSTITNSQFTPYDKSSYLPYDRSSYVPQDKSSYLKQDTQYEGSTRKLSSHLRELLEKVKRDEEVYKQKREDLDKVLHEKRMKQMIYDPSLHKVDYLALLKNTLSQRRSRSSQQYPTSSWGSYDN